MSQRTLLSTPWMSPHKIISWQDAITMLFLGKVEVLEEYDETIRSPSVSMKTPAVVRLTRGLGSIKRGVKFSRINVLTRDGFRCQYCGSKGSAADLNYDHVLPRALGGKTVWENIVASCYPCNTRKGQRTPEQAGMRLLSKPHKPKTLPMTQPLISASNIHPIWFNWIGGGGGAVAAQVA